MKIPSQIFAGDSATWKDDPTVDNLGNTIDSTWTLKYVISFATAVTLTASTDGSGWSTTISKAQSAVTAGDYYWQAYVESGSERITLGRGVLTVLPAAGDAISGKSQAKQDLEAVEAAIRSLSTSGVQEYTIGTRTMRKADLASLIVWRDRLKAEVARENAAEKIANGLGDPRSVYVRFR